MISVYAKVVLSALLLIHGLLSSPCTALGSPGSAQYMPYENVALIRVLSLEQRQKGLVFFSFEVLDSIRGNWKNEQIVTVYFFDAAKRLLPLPKESKAVIFLNYCDRRQKQPALEESGKKFELVQLPFLQKDPVDIKEMKNLFGISPYHKEIVMSAALHRAYPVDGGKKVGLSVCDLTLLHGKVDNLPSAALFELQADQVSGFTKLPISSRGKHFVILEARSVWTTPKSKLLRFEEGAAKLVPNAEISARSKQLQLCFESRKLEKMRLIEFLMQTWTPEKIALYCSPYSADLPDDQVYTGFGYDNIWSGSLYSSLQNTLGKVDWKCGLVHHRPDGCVIEVQKSGMRWTIAVDLSQYPLTLDEVYRMRVISTLRRWTLESMKRTKSNPLPMVSFDSKVELDRSGSLIKGATIYDSTIGRVDLKLGADLQIESVRFEKGSVN